MYKEAALAVEGESAKESFREVIEAVRIAERVKQSEWNMEVARVRGLTHNRGVCQGGSEEVHRDGHAKAKRQADYKYSRGHAREPRECGEE